MSAPGVFRPLRLLIVIAACGMGCADTMAPTGPPRSFGFSVKGPASVAPGATASFQAFEHLSNGSMVDVSAQVTWQTIPPHVLAITSNGVAIGASRGEAVVKARHERGEGVWPVLVLEDGTFVLSGSIREANAGIGGLFDADIEVTQGIGAGLRARSTDAIGAFALYGVAGPIQLRISADGYETHTIAINVTRPHFQSFFLTPTATPPGSLSGDWDLTLLSPPCDWPPGVPQQFDLSAHLLHTGSTRVAGTLTGGFVLSDGRVIGQVRGDELILPLPFWPGDIVDGPSYALKVGWNWDLISHVGVRGLIRARLSGSSAVGVFEGAMDYHAPPGYLRVCEGTSTVTLRQKKP